MLDAMGDGMEDFVKVGNQGIDLYSMSGLNAKVVEGVLGDVARFWWR